jgi:hypothetical protein
LLLLLLLYININTILVVIIILIRRKLLLLLLLPAAVDVWVRMSKAPNKMKCATGALLILTHMLYAAGCCSAADVKNKNNVETFRQYEGRRQTAPRLYEQKI